MLRAVSLAVVFISSCSLSNAQQASLTSAAFADPRKYVQESIAGYNKKIKSARQKKPSTFEINMCMYHDEDRATPNYLLIVFLEKIAEFDSAYANELTMAGYPESVWRAPLDEITQKQIDVVVRRNKNNESLDYGEIRKEVLPLERKLVAALQRFRKQSSKRLPSYSIGWESGCGGDYIGYVRVRAVPAGGAVKVIREFYFQLCGDKGDLICAKRRALRPECPSCMV
jgi:hypothetical protein